MITDSELLEMESQYQAATSGPWKSWVEGRDHESGDHFISTAADDIYLSAATLADQDLSRQNVPRLISEVKRLNALFGNKFTHS